MNPLWPLWAALDPVDSLTLIQWIMWWLLVLWLLCVGGCFGSFMNVVIYRLPAGLSVTKPASRCPQCLHAIRGRDNVPVISWLLLRGRCRDCQTPVSARYPTIEGIVALMCVTLALAEVFPGGQGLPTEVQYDLQANPWQLWTMFSGHLLLLCTLVCAVMIQFDGHAVPWRLFVPIMLVSAAMAVMVPEACRIRWSVSPSGTWAGNLVQALMAAACGAFAGATLAVFTRESNRILRGGWGLGFFVAIITLFVGWISGLLIAVLSGVLALAQRKLTRRFPSLEHIPTLAWTLLVTYVLLVAWRWLLPHFPVLALDSASSFAVATVVALLLISATAWWLGPWSPLYWGPEGGPFGGGRESRDRTDRRSQATNEMPLDIEDDEPIDVPVTRREATDDSSTADDDDNDGDEDGRENGNDDKRRGKRSSPGETS